MANVNDLGIDQHGLQFIEGWEAFVAYWYDDKVAPHAVKGKGLVYREYTGGEVRGTLTIGIGHTKAAKANVPFQIGARMSHEEAREILNIDLDPCEAIVNRRVKVKLTQGMFNALVSFVYNCGEGTFIKSSLLAKLNKGNYAGARASFSLYTRSKGEVMRGLVRRRAGEQALWDEDGEVLAALSPTASEEAMSHAVPKADGEPTQVTSILQSKEAMTAAGQVAVGSAGVVKESSTAMDHVDKVIEVKDKAEQLGVEPIDVFQKIGPVLDHLIHQPLFWVCVAVIVFGGYQFYKRRQRMIQEGS
jgi:lysozyme